MKRHGPARAITTNGLRSCTAAMKALGNAGKQEIGRWANNRVENSHLPFRRRERAMLRFRQMKTLQKFSSVHAAFHNHFNQDRHLISRETYKAQSSAALAEWKTLAGQALRPLPWLRPVETSCRWTDSTRFFTRPRTFGARVRYQF
jgi:putative transposase